MWYLTNRFRLQQIFVQISSTQYLSYPSGIILAIWFHACASAMFFHFACIPPCNVEIGMSQAPIQSVTSWNPGIGGIICKSYYFSKKTVTKIALFFSSGTGYERRWTFLYRLGRSTMHMCHTHTLWVCHSVMRAFVLYVHLVSTTVLCLVSSVMQKNSSAIQHDALWWLPVTWCEPPRIMANAGGKVPLWFYEFHSTPQFHLKDKGRFCVSPIFSKCYLPLAIKIWGTDLIAA